MKEQVSYLKLEADVRQRYAGSEWLTITLNLMSAILVGANFNSKAADVGCSIFNLAQMLADIKNKILIDDCIGKIKCPFAKPLLAGNKQEEDNVFIEYVSALDNSPTHSLNQRSFLEDEHGLCVDKLFEQVTDEGVPIPRPMKSCHPTGSCHTEVALWHMGRARPVRVTLQRGFSTPIYVQQTF